jgi:GTP 3',8-cyclase
MFDQFNRRINYLRISVTDRCNLRCQYCMPEEGIKLLEHKDILTYNEITEIVKEAVSQGINKIRITGGEPLVRKNIVSLVAMIAEIRGITDFGMTTNGVLLAEYAKELKKAGLHRLNISLDTVRNEKFREITRFDDLNKVLAGIKKAQEAGFETIKINCVIKSSPDEPDAMEVSKFCKENNLQIRHIRQMDLQNGRFWKVSGGDGGDCANCNRLRITANGKLKPCLFSNLEFDIRKLGISQALQMALAQKPECGQINTSNFFNNIGG